VQNPNFIAEFHKGGSSYADLAQTFQTILGADYVLIIDNQGVLRGRSDNPTESGYEYNPPMVVGALEGQQDNGYVTQNDRRLYLAVATPLREASSQIVLGAIVATHQVTDSLAREIQRASGSEIVFYLLDSLNQAVTVASTVPGSPRLQAVLERVAAESGAAPRVDATIGDEHLVGIAGALQNAGRPPLGGYVALQSRDAELAGFRRTQRTLLLAGLVGLALALAGAWTVARVIGRRVRELVAGARRVAAGDYDARVAATTRDEIGELATAFQRMVEELKAKQQLVELLTSGPQQATQPLSAAAAGGAATIAVRRPGGGGNTGLLEPGQMFDGRYEIKGVLGMGGMGVVYRAWDTQLAESVAIKTLRLDFASTEPAALERFKQEIRLARKITHRNVVRTHDIGQVDGLYYITMEYVEGQSLKHLIQARGPLPVNAALTVGKQLCRALEVAHEQGVIHRDIKPQNLIVEPSGTLKVMDFGIARLATRTQGMTQAGMAVGTPEYMAPEQLLGAEVDFRVDLYATGAVLFESLTGRPPFVADSAITLVAKRLEETPPSPSELNHDVPEPLSALVLRTLSRDPKDRPQSATALFEALDAVAA